MLSTHAHLDELSECSVERLVRFDQLFSHTRQCIGCLLPDTIAFYQRATTRASAMSSRLVLVWQKVSTFPLCWIWWPGCVRVPVTHACVYSRCRLEPVALTIFKFVDILKGMASICQGSVVMTCVVNFTPTTCVLKSFVRDAITACRVLTAGWRRCSVCH